MSNLKSRSLLINSYVIDSPQPGNLSYMWNSGSLLAFSPIMLVIIGVTLSSFLAQLFNFWFFISQLSKFCWFFSKPITRSHGFVKVSLKSGFHFVGFKLVIFKSGNVNISGTYSMEYLDYIKNIIHNMMVSTNSALKYTCNTDLLEYIKLSSIPYPSPIKQCLNGNVTENIAQVTHLLLSYKAKYPSLGLHHVYPDTLSTIWHLLHINPSLFSLLIPVILYRTLPQFYQHISVYVHTGTTSVQETRLEQLNTEFTNRYDLIMGRIAIAHNNWTSYWNFVENLRREGVIVILDAGIGIGQVSWPARSSENLMRRAERLMPQSVRLTGDLVDIVDLIARNRFTSWLINLEDSTFVGNDEVVLHELMNVLELTHNFYNRHDFQDRLDEITNNLINSYRENQSNSSFEALGKRARSEEPDEDQGGPSSKKKTS